MIHTKYINDCICGSDEQIIKGRFIYNWIECRNCGRRSAKFDRLDDAIKDWNERRRRYDQKNR